MRLPFGAGPPAGILTARERLTLRLFCQGRSYAEIAGVHGNSPATVRNTIYRVQDRLGVGSKPELVVWAVRSGLLDDEDRRNDEA